MIKVGIVGYGTIGKRVGDAIALQDDMKVVGVTAKSYNFRLQTAHDLGIPIYTTDNDSVEAMKKAKIPVLGDMDALCKACDVLVDCTPKNGVEYKEKYYSKYPVKVIFQGGEPDSVADTSFTATANYADALGKKYVRVVSCNTTGLVRLLHTLDTKFGIEKVYAVLIRRSADQGDVKTGPINAICPELKVPSHHGPDVKTVLKNMNILTTALKVPTTLMHVHNLHITFKKPVTKEEVIAQLDSTMRLKLFSKEQKLDNTAALLEWARDMGSKRGDLMELAVWRESIYCDGKDCYLMAAIHQESDVIPDNIDALRAVTGEKDAMKSIKKTNRTLGLKG